MRIFGAKGNDASPCPVYATSADFYQIFESDMNRLYLLSLLLTADGELAERCFVLGLQDSKSNDRVFKEWAESWARRTIVKSAIRLIAPRPGGVASAPGSTFRPHNTRLPAELAAVVGLRTFDRFIFVMSVLEGYSEHDCKLLLNCSSADIAQGRIRALQELGALVERFRKVKNAKQLQLQADSFELGLADWKTLYSAVSA